MYLFFILLLFFYYFSKTIIYNLLIFQLFIEEKYVFVKNKIINNNGLTFYRLNDFKKTNYKNEIMIHKVYHDNNIKYKITSNPDTKYIKTPDLFSSVILTIGNNGFDVTSICNEFIFPNTIIHFNIEFAKIICFFNKINIDINNLDNNDNNVNIEWGIITNKIQMFNSENIKLHINENYLIEYKD